MNFTHLLKPAPSDPAEAFTLSDRMIRRLSRLMPGQTLLLVLPDGNEFAVMPADDYRHVMQLSGLHFKDGDG